ncbi:hypothetical protein KDD30_23920 (plasmid) [Photobacterium sp. GJ3]|uniref:hypothetical protein n=1 Tax=Photobacterium sp. GJ3 TaxID=2829502 RepID=UPI001B8B0499|nr:hypothetical protein [Photobacterium sp. GJ3]QUJ69766.1 hypothetical protein KDD30_23920 [Photobacterium sp. GJ3]
MKKQFKHLPKCTEEYKQQQIQQVLEADVIYEWECDLVQGLRWVQTSCVVLMSFVFAVLLGDSWGWYLAFGLLGLVMGSASYFLYQSTKRQHVKLTEHGIIVSTVELVPEVFYVATRYAAYVGIVVCLLAVIFVGPLAFVGAGAGALMAFKMTGFNNDPKVKAFPFLKTLKYTIWTDFENPSFENGVNSVSFKNMDLMPRENDDGDDLYGELRRFHCVVYSCNKEQQKVIESCLKGVISTESDDEYMSKIKREKNSADKISTS